MIEQHCATCTCDAPAAAEYEQQIRAEERERVLGVVALLVNDGAMEAVRAWLGADTEGAPNAE